MTSEHGGVIKQKELFVIPNGTILESILSFSTQLWKTETVKGERVIGRRDSLRRVRKVNDAPWTVLYNNRWYRISDEQADCFMVKKKEESAQ